jgi:hypothetical protein
VSLAGWPKHPVVYEINTWVWLHELSRTAGRALDLAGVPDEELERLAGLGFDAVWLMGVWRRSPASRDVARDHPDLQFAYRAALPDFSAADVVGSPYAIADYTVDPALGGDGALAALRRRLAERGLRLILDFVPNHVALDHAWVREHPARLLRGTDEDLARAPSEFYRDPVSGGVFAHGRDPYFPPWTDTLQVDYRSVETRRAMADVLLSLAERCDGARCDMAMLVLRDVFLRTWGGAFAPELAEFWPAAITDVRARRPDFLLVAEAYWNLEDELRRHGFDYAYDKELYDRLVRSDARAADEHLGAPFERQCGRVRFVENHDERRAADVFGAAASRAAAVLALTVPGLKLVHEGQLEGRRVRLPVQLGRRCPEAADADMERFYRTLLAALRAPCFRAGDWRRLHAGGETPSIIAHRWRRGDEARIVVVNLSDEPSHFAVSCALEPKDASSWRLRDPFEDGDAVQTADPQGILTLRGTLPARGFRLVEASPAPS